MVQYAGPVIRKERSYMRKQDKILAIDDHPTNISILENLLGEKYNLKTATTGEKALEIAVDFQPDIILLDIMMPGMNGYEVCRQMRASPSLRHVKIIMVSAKAMTSERLKGYESGADDYIITPFDGDELLAKVRVYLRLRALEEVEILNRELQSTIQKLSQANKLLEDFAHIAAHDLKTPLRGIATLADWISNDYADKLDEQGKEQVRLITTKAKQMNAMIDGILRYSMLETVAPEKQKVDLNTVLSEVIAGIAPPENIEITVENELPTLMCQRTQMMQVFQNLLSNAVQHMDKTKGQIKVGCVKQDGFWKFSVTDNGPGIDEKYFEKVFEIFQILPSRDGIESTKSTGVGLSIVRKVAELNGGRAWVESEVGKGSSFFFTLPNEETGVISDQRQLLLPSDGS